jgi:hypothetical protein
VRFVRDQAWKLYDDGRFYHIAEDVEEKQPLEASAAPEVHAKLEAALGSTPAEGRLLLDFD